MKLTFLRAASAGLILMGLSIFSASATLIASDDFTGGTSGWTDNRTSLIDSNEVLGGFNLFGVGVVAEKTFTLSGNQTSVNISLDFWKGDSWDGERFFVYVDNNLLFNQPYTYSQGSQISGMSHIDWNELLVPISIDYSTTASTVTVRFASSLDQVASDEWWAVDNFVITDNLIADSNIEVVSEPASFALLGLGLMGLALRRFKKES
jgi:hypothetical protein